MAEKLEVYDYSIDQLCSLLASKSENSTSTISAKLHHQYFQGYCEYIGVKTIVVENDYVDQHFLEDYAAYYVRCFKPYRRFCTRLHFFKNSFDDKALEQFLSKGSGESSDFASALQQNYLGFVVVKPLPQTIVGRTCLATYPEEGRRSFPIVRTYEANLFGTKLTVNSLAFQEQDRVVAACATSALWSLFHGTGKAFQHVIPSPVEITRAATEKLPLETRVLPNRGLSTAMMAHAIRHVGLEPDLITVQNEHILKGTVYAYLRGHIPMLLGIELWDTSVQPHELKGFHAVALTGYSLGREQPTSIGETGFLLRASRIDKLYVHDDQVGPFARMAIDGGTIHVDYDTNGEPITSGSLSTSWKGKNQVIGSVRARPTILLVPVYHKIRIPFSRAHDAVLQFNAFFESLRHAAPEAYNGQLEWDIYLCTNNDLKSELHSNGYAKGNHLKEVLVAGLPRFLWRATALQSESPVMDLVFDATDIEQGSFFLRAIEYDKDLSVWLRILSKINTIVDEHKGTAAEEIIDWFRESEDELPL